MYYFINLLKRYKNKVYRVLKQNIKIKKEYIIVKYSKFFNKKWYLKTYQDVAKTNLNPVQHFIEIGWKKGYNPSPKFDTNKYLMKYWDIKTAKINPLFHYEVAGKNEGREFFELSIEYVYLLSLVKVDEYYEFSFYTNRNVKDIVLIADNKKYYPLPYNEYNTEKKSYSKYLMNSNDKLIIYRLPFKPACVTLSSTCRLAIRVQNYNNFNGIYFKLKNNRIVFHGRTSHILSNLLSLSVKLRYKYYILLALFAKKKNILFLEAGHNNNDNAFQLFKEYSKYVDNVYFVTNKAVYENSPIEERDKYVIRNSNKFNKLFIKSKIVVNSYMFYNMQNEKLSSIIMPLLDYDKYFVPHGISCDKNSYYLNFRNLSQPDHIFCASKYEKEYFERKCGLKNVQVTGYPRMDKWDISKECINSNSIIIFFTWRKKLYTNFIDTVYQLLQYIHTHYATTEVHFVLHQNMHPLYAKKIKRIVSKFGVNIISALDREQFNNVFNSSFLLITDYSSVAYDFMYNKYKKVIFYKPIADLNPEYDILPIWNKINMCYLVKHYEEIGKIIELDENTLEIQHRQRDFYCSIDHDNTHRVMYYINKYSNLYSYKQQDLSYEDYIDKRLSHNNVEGNFYTVIMFASADAYKNTESYNSILSQQYSNFEIKILAHESQKEVLYDKYINEQIYYYNNCAQTLAIILKESKGEYVCFCNSGDKWNKNHILNYNIIIDDKTVICTDKPFFHEQTMMAKSIKQYISNPLYNNIKINIFLEKNIPLYSLTSICIKKSVLMNYSHLLQNDINEDIYRVYRLILLENNLYYTCETTTKYDDIAYFEANFTEEKLEETYHSDLKYITSLKLCKNMQQKKRPYNKYDSRYITINKSGYFDKEYYLAKYPEVYGFRYDALTHFIYVGDKLHYNPSSKFNTEKYLKRYWDIEKGKVVTLYHYLLNGIKEKRAKYTDEEESYVLYEVEHADAPYVLLVSHILNYTGAPILLLNIGKLLKAKGYNVIVLSPSDGILKDEMLKYGLEVIVDINPYICNTIGEYYTSKNIKLCICNTYLTHHAYNNFSKYFKSILWIHENITSRILYESLVNTIRNSRDIYVPSEMTKEYIEYFNPYIKILHYPVKDICAEKDFNKKLIDEKTITIGIVGTVQARKGQDILLQAYNDLDIEVRRNIKIIIMGDTIDKKYYNQIKKIISKNKNVRFVKPRENIEEYHKIYDEIDYLVCSSREDPYPLVVIDALMHGCPIIVSNKVGQKEIIVSGENGYMFTFKKKLDDTGKSELTEILEICYNTRDEYTLLSNNARQTFVSQFDEDSFFIRLLHIMESVDEKNHYNR